MKDLIGWIVGHDSFYATPQLFLPVMPETQMEGTVNSL